MWCTWLVAIAWGAPAEVRVAGSLYASDAVAVGADGTAHALIAPRSTRLGRIVASVTVTTDEGVRRLGGSPLRHLVLHRDGTHAETAIPGPRGADWSGEDRVGLAALGLDDDGRVVIAALGQNCPEDVQGCTPRLWVSVGSDGAFVTQSIPLDAGSWSGLALRAGGPDGWTLALHHTGAVDGGFTGIVRIDGTRTTPWIPVARARPQQLVVVDGELGCLYREGSQVRLHLAGLDHDLGDGARHRADAVALPSGVVHHQHYRATDKRLVGGVLGGALADRDTPESGWHNALAVTPDGQAVSAWYVYRNAWNKGVRMGLPGSGAAWTVARSETQNLGWGLDLDIGADGTVALVAHDRADHVVSLSRWPSLADVQADAVPDADDWTDRRRGSFLFAYGGGWYQWWGISTSPPDPEDFTYGAVEPTEGRYGVQPGLGLEGGFAGKIGPVNLVVEYMRRSDDDEAIQTIQKLQNLMAKIGIDDLPAPDTEMQLHFRTASLDGRYVGSDGVARDFVADEQLVELRYVGKQGYHFGLRYHGFGGPQDVALSDNRVLTEAFVADARFVEGAFVGGWAVLDYLKKYETRYVGPALDAQLGLGLANVALVHPDTGVTLNHLGITLPGSLDLSLVAYRRFRNLQGAGGFLRVGARALGQLTTASEPADADGEGPYVNFRRVDGRFGPTAHVGGVF